MSPRASGSVVKLSVASYLATGLGILTGPLVARALGPGGRGELAAVVAHSTLLALFVGAGLPVAVKVRAAADPQRANAVLFAGVRAAVASLPLACLIAFVAVQSSLAEVSPAAKVGAVVLLVGLPLAVIRSCLQAHAIAEGRLRSLAAMRLLPTLGSTALVVGAFVAGRLTMGIAIGAAFFSILIEVVVLLAGAGRWWRAKPAPLRPLLSFGWRGLVGQLAESTNMRLDQILLVAVVPTAALGHYAVAVTVALLPTVLIQSVAVRFFGDIARGAPDVRAELIERAIRLGTVLALLITVMLAIVSPALVPVVYGSNFDEAVVLVLLLLPGTVLFAMSYLASTALLAIGRPLASASGLLAGTVVTVLLFVPVVNRYGVRGAAVLSVATYLTSFMLLRHLLKGEGVYRFRPAWSDVRTLPSAVRGHDRRRPAPVADDVAGALSEPEAAALVDAVRT